MNEGLEAYLEARMADLQERYPEVLTATFRLYEPRGDRDNGLAISLTTIPLPESEVPSTADVYQTEEATIKIGTAKDFPGDRGVKILCAGEALTKATVSIFNHADLQAAFGDRQEIVFPQ